MTSGRTYTTGLGTQAGGLIGKGLYSIPEGARYLGIKSQKLRRWSLGYDFRLRDGSLSSAPGFLRKEVLRVDQEPVITFADLIELQFVNLFRQYGVSMPVIRAAAERAARLFGSEHPFTINRLQTDGVNIFAETDIDHIELDPEFNATRGPKITREKIAQDLRTGQLVVRSFALPYYKNLEYDHQVASRWWPLGKDNRVVLDPLRNFGKPMDSETGMPLDPLARLIRAGETVADTADWYGVPEDAVVAAIQFENQFPP